MHKKVMFYEWINWLIFASIEPYEFSLQSLDAATNLWLSVYPGVRCWRLYENKSEEYDT